MCYQGEDVLYSLVHFDKNSNIFWIIIDDLSAMIMIVIMKMTNTMMIK
jgi:hypothetical protein